MDSSVEIETSQLAPLIDTNKSPHNSNDSSGLILNEKNKLVDTEVSQVTKQLQDNDVEDIDVRDREDLSKSKKSRQHHAPDAPDKLVRLVQLPVELWRSIFAWYAQQHPSTIAILSTCIAWRQCLLAAPVVLVSHLASSAELPFRFIQRSAASEPDSLNIVLTDKVLKVTPGPGISQNLTLHQLQHFLHLTSHIKSIGRDSFATPYLGASRDSFRGKTMLWSPEPWPQTSLMTNAQRLDANVQQALNRFSSNLSNEFGDHQIIITEDTLDSSAILRQAWIRAFLSGGQFLCMRCRWDTRDVRSHGNKFFSPTLAGSSAVPLEQVTINHFRLVHGSFCR